MRRSPATCSRSTTRRAHGSGLEDPETLAQELRRVALPGVVEFKANPFGEKYVIRNEVDAPRGTRLAVETVWIRTPGSEAPRFVTAYPRR